MPLTVEANPNPRRSSHVVVGGGGWVARVRLGGGVDLYLGCGGWDEDFWIGTIGFGFGGYYVKKLATDWTAADLKLAATDDEIREAVELLVVAAGLMAQPDDPVANPS